MIQASSVKKEFKYAIVSVICLLLGLVSFGGTAFSASALPKGVIVGDDTGIRIEKDGKYFVEHTDIKPGMTFTKAITISNYAQTVETYKLRMDMHEDLTSGAINLLKAIYLRLELDGKLVYEGDLAGKTADSSYTLPVELGEYSTGDTKTMLATFTVSKDYPISMWKEPNSADFYWVFYAINETETSQPKPPQKPKPKPGILPQTSEEWTFILMGVGITLFVMSLILFISKKSQENQ